MNCELEWYEMKTQNTKSIWNLRWPVCIYTAQMKGKRLVISLKIRVTDTYIKHLVHGEIDPTWKGNLIGEIA